MWKQCVSTAPRRTCPRPCAAHLGTHQHCGARRPPGRSRWTGNRTEQNSHMNTIDSRNSSQSTHSSASMMHSFHSCCCCATHSNHSRNVFPATPITPFAVWTLLRAATFTEHGEDLPPQACRARRSTVWTEHSGEDGGAGAG